MQLTKIFTLAIMALGVAANTHEACSCNGGRDCTYTACDSYNTWFNLPPGKDRGFVSKQNDRCYAIWSNPASGAWESFQGFGGNEFRAACEAACGSGSRCGGA
ncbi:hypothetical protein B0T11DRAFT_330233 [Plectosphaerella cucumerina]|uniref:Uncharacterized protein n=1 Tax=Plectosphaerella cucumerina TaxID=40658 RepID=A0A8K0X1N8_9PEZI|nr:hypothetical protein B0T11DRAFT_330233 [Plectosphaerella cucumerina]